MTADDRVKSLCVWVVFKIQGFVGKRFLPFFPSPSPSFYWLHFRAAILCSRTSQKRLLRRLVTLRPWRSRRAEKEHAVIPTTAIHGYFVLFPVSLAWRDQDGGSSNFRPQRPQCEVDPSDHRDLGGDPRHLPITLLFLCKRLCKRKWQRQLSPVGRSESVPVRKLSSVQEFFGWWSGWIVTSHA